VRREERVVKEMEGEGKRKGGTQKGAGGMNKMKSRS
jgi:hypothetical protein